MVQLPQGLLLHELLPQEGLLKAPQLLPVGHPLLEAQLLPLEGLLQGLLLEGLLVAFLHHLFQNNCNNNIIAPTKR
jgi:hypothetical protein